MRGEFGAIALKGTPSTRGGLVLKSRFPNPKIAFNVGLGVVARKSLA